MLNYPEIISIVVNKLEQEIIRTLLYRAQLTNIVNFVSKYYNRATVNKVSNVINECLTILK